MNLSEREQRFFDELYETFPDAREVTKGAGESVHRWPGYGCVGDGAHTITPAPVATSQVSLFGQGGLDEDA